MSAARRIVYARIRREIRRARSGTGRRSRAIKIRSLRCVGSCNFFGERGDQRVDVCENFLHDFRMRRSDIIALFTRLPVLLSRASERWVYMVKMNRRELGKGVVASVVGPSLAPITSGNAQSSARSSVVELQSSGPG